MVHYGGNSLVHIGGNSTITAHSERKGVEGRKNLLYFAGHLATLGMFDKTLCTEFLEMVDTNTAEVLASVRLEASKAYSEELDWSDTVGKLIDQYPKYFEQIKKHEKLLQYEAESKTEAVKQKRIIASPPVQSPKQDSKTEDAEKDQS